MKSSILACELYSFRGVIPEPFQRSDVIPDNLTEVIVAGKTGEDTLAVPVVQFLKCQIRRQDRGSLLQVSLFNEVIKLGGCKAVGKLCSEIINNEKITVDQVVHFDLNLFAFFSFAKPAFL